MDKKNELRLAHYLLLWSSLFYVFSQTFVSIKEGVNGVNLLATKGEKYILTTDKTRKENHQLPTGKILTDYRHEPNCNN